MTRPARPGAGRWLGRAMLGAVLIAVLVVGGTAFRVWQVARQDDRERADVIVVLGAAEYNGTPSRVFRARLAHAKGLYDDGVAPQLVTVGGGRAGDRYTEASAGRKWLAEQGVPASRVTAVNEGNDTIRSLRAVAETVHARGWSTAVVVSDPWHSLRARTMANDQGLESWSSPTRTGPAVQTRETQAWNIIRETGALMFYRVTQAPAEDIHNAE